ncbi:MAG: tRNA 2-thiouridine(34) synthase MnmA [Gammaproteobacteria bacterium]|nr:tRNA 2-thiouridine(34) synthase MnmA [Gammaproteobacteria bacterium]
MAGSVVVGMSGGVDSAVAAHILKGQGYEVTGLFMKNWEEDDASEYCTALADFGDAAAVCDKLGIELLTANFAAEYWDNVFEAFLDDFRAGYTPNPDVLCNREIKFKVFADYARDLGFETVATGHYARRSAVGTPFRLLKSHDPDKDQTYFLQAVPASRLEHCLFPIGGLTKPAVRQRARRAGFDVHDKKDSTGICFIGERRFDDFLARYVRGEPGPIRDADGTLLGRHRGLPFYTLGQRQGIGLGGIKGRREQPWYVAAKDIGTNTLTVTQDEGDLETTWLHATNLNWISPSMNGSDGFEAVRCTAKIRYRQPEQACRLENDGKLARVVFDTPQRAATPGQFVAFYDGNECLGGGRIVEAGCPGG